MIANTQAAVTYRIARTADDRTQAFRLVYKAYVAAGLDAPNPHGVRLIPQHLLPTTEVFLAELPRRQATIATVTLVGDGAMGLPMESAYSDEVARYRRAGRRIAEVSCLAESHEQTGSSFPVILRIMGLMAQCAKYRGVQDLLIAIHPRHARFYERFIAFKTIGRETSYAKVCDHPAVAMALDLSRLHLDHPKVYQRFFGDRFADHELAMQTLDAWSGEYAEQMAVWGEVLESQRRRDAFHGRASVPPLAMLTGRAA